MGLGDLWNPNLHPRGFHGRFIKKFKLAPWLDDALKNFAPRQFQSQGQANQFAFNQPKKIGKDLLATRRIKMDFDEAADHLRNGDIDPTTQKFMAAIDPHFEPAPPGGLILSRTFGPEALGLGPEHLVENDPNGIEGMMGNTLQDKMYSPTHLGQDISPGPGKITMRIATPAGTPVAYSGTNPNDPGVYLNRDQKLLVTQVSPDGRGGWFMSVVAEPPGATSGSPVAAVQGRKGAGLNPAQREARIGGPSVFKQAAPPPSGDSTGHQLNIPGQAVEPGPPQTPEQRAAAAPARAARQAGYQQARQAEGNAPLPPQAPQPVQPQPAQNAPSVGARTEPVHGPIGGVPTEGKSASEIANTPPAPSPSPAPTGLQEGPAPAATFRQAFHDAKLEYPSRGKQRSEVNDAFLGAATGKKHPQDALRQLEADIKHNERAVQDLQPDSPQAREMHDNIDKQRKIADFMAQHFNLPREGKANAPETPAPEAPAAPTKTFFKTVKELTPQERGKYDSLSQADKAKYLTRRRAGQGHDQALAGIEAKKAAPAKAAPEPRKGLTTAGQESPNALPPLHTAKAPTAKAPARKFAAPEVGPGQTTRGGPHGVQVGDEIRGQKVASINREGGRFNFMDSEGKQIATIAPQGKVEWRRAGGPQGGAPEKKIAKAAEKVAPTPTAPSKATAAKVAEAAPAAKAVSEVQTRADAAGLPKTVTALRQAAREKKIRGFSTMNKEQLQRALMGEEVGTGGKLGPIAPDKLSGHIQAAATDQAARNLMEDHTVADLKALAKHNGVDLKGITTKDRIKDAVIKHLRGEGPGTLRPEVPKESLHEQIKGNKILDKGLGKEPDIKSIVDGVHENDPASLRSGRDDLEKIAEDTKTSDPIRSRIAQEAADAMGMRAQQISGVEEAPAAKKAVKAVKKAAAPKLSVHQERVRKQALADGATEEEARAAAEAAPVRAPAGTKAAVAKATKARQAAGLPTPREEGTPGPKLTTAKRAAKVTPPAKEGIPGGPGRVQPQGVREAAAPGDLLSPESTRKLRAAGMEPGVPGRGRIQSRDLKPGDRVMVERDSEGQLVPEMVRGDKAAFPVDVVKQNPDGSVQVKDNAGNLHNTVPEAPRGTSYRPETPTEARRAAKAAAKPTKSGIPPADEAKFKAAGVKPNKVVPQGSVKGERAQTPIDNQFRAHEFDAAYMKHVDKRGNVSDHAVESQDQVAADISEGRITPEEGIRRIESEISFNNEEISNLSRDIRSGNLQGAQLNQARHDLNQLERDNASHESLSRDLHQHFGKERVTPNEVANQIEKANPGFWDGLNKQDPEQFRRDLESGTGLGPLKGDNAQEIFKDALQKTIKKSLEERAAKSAKKAAPRKAIPWTPGPPEAKPDFSPGGAKHLDAKAIAGDLNLPPGELDRVQADLNSGMTPGQAAKNLARHAEARRTSGVFQHGGWHGERKGPDALQQNAEDKAALEKIRAESDQMDQLANRLKSARRPIVRKAAPAKAVENISQAEQATRSPAAKKALAEAKTQVQEAHDEMGKLRERITARHQEAWDKSTTAKEAEAAAESMRKELTFGEIRDIFGKQGITGRSKADIFKKAIERRFGGEGNISPEKVTSPTGAQRVANRMEEGARVSRIGSAFSNVDELLANGASERAVRHRIDSAGLEPGLATKVREAALSGDRGTLDRLAQEQGLTRNTGVPGTVEPFEPGKHRAITGNHRKGEAVRVVSPGYQGTVEGRAFQAHPATVLAATPEEKQAMLDRLAQQRRESIANLPAETRAAVLARSAKQAQNPMAQKLAKKAAAAKGITPPEPLPMNPAEEKAANLARLNAAKAVKAAAPEAKLPSRQTPEGAAPVKSAHIRDFGPGLAERLGRSNGDESLKLPNGGQDQGLIHMDSSIGSLWSDLAADPRTSNSTLNKINQIGNDLGTGKVDLPTARALIRDIKPGDAQVRERINKAVGDLEVKPTKLDLPENVPAEVRKLLDNINEIPAYHNKGSLSHGAAGPTPMEEIAKLVRDISNGNEGPGGDMKLLRAVENPHESGDGVYQARRDAAKALFPGNQSPEVRNWFRSWRNKEQAPEAPKATAPAKAAFDPAAIRAQLAKATTQEEARRVLSGLTIPELKQINPNLPPGNKESHISNIITANSGVAKVGDMAKGVASEPLPIPTRKGATVGELKGIKKAAPAKVTQAELRNPVAKVGNAAPSATPSQIQAKGLTPGEGVPTANFLALKNKLPRSSELTKLDTAVRIPARRAEIPELMAKIENQLQQAGVGPNDEPRRTLMAWYREHFKV